MSLHDYCTRQGCGARLVATTDGNGGIIVSCPPCARNKAGQCRDCPAPLASKRGLRCEPCRKARHRAMQRRHYDANRDAILAQQRAYLQRPEVRTRRKAYMDDYNARYFGDELGRKMHIVSTQRWRQTPEGRKATRAAKKRSYAKHAERERARRREYYQQNRELEIAKQRERRERKRQQRQAVAA